MASDAVSSVAYAVQEMLLVLIPLGGYAAFQKLGLVALPIVILLLTLVVSYSQIINHYPNGGGAYVVSRETLGIIPAMIAAAALVVDYVLTVAVSVSSSTAAIVSAFPALSGYQVLISVLSVALVTVINLRGVRESAKIFGIPTYLFIVCMVLMIVVGFIRVLTGSLHSMVTVQQFDMANAGKQFEAVGIFIILRAFASGCSALTGVEAVSNAVPSFTSPSRKHAKHVLYWLGGIIIFTFGGTALLAGIIKPWSLSDPGFTNVTALSLMGSAVFGQGTFFYYALQFTTSLILLLAANTAYNGLPMLLSILAKDGYVPKQFAFRGTKLSFSNGILFIAILAIVLIIYFRSDTHSLIPLYAVGVFFSFTLSQYGMFIKWIREKEKGWQYKFWINGLGAIISGVGSIVVLAYKFLEGAYILAVVIPGLICLMLGIHRHYTATKKQLSLDDETPYYIMTDKSSSHRGHCIVLINSVNKAMMKTLNYANSLFDDVIALHVSDNTEAAKRLKKQWDLLHLGLPLEIISTPFRDIIAPLEDYISALEKNIPHGESITVVMVKYISPHFTDRALHNQTTYFISNNLARHKNVVIVQVPYILGTYRHIMLEDPAHQAAEEQARETVAAMDAAEETTKEDAKSESAASKPSK